MTTSDEYIIVTGGAGYIGSHTVIELIQNNYKVIIVDNLINSSYDAVARLEFIVKQKIPFFKTDIRNYDQLSKIFKQYKISGVIHFAALKAVGESTKIPLTYYDNNINGTINLLKVMNENNVKTIVFSSSATVYGDATRFENMIPIPENCPNDPTNPYGKTKYVIEQLLNDLYTSDNHWSMAILRYFNPIGAHPSGLIGEDPLGIPNNLLPYLAQVAIGRRDKLSIFGNDYDSHDGTPIRDYIHVVDLAKGHISALNYLKTKNSNNGLFREWNLGTGKGSTVFDVYHAFCKAVGRDLPFEVVGRRDGDVLNLTANPKRANTELNWFAHLSIEDACNDLWKWTTENPFGFKVENYSWKMWESNENYENRLHEIKFGNFNVGILNHGATIQNISINNHPLVLGFDNQSSYNSSQNPFFGATIGRVANRISNGEFKLGDTLIKLDKNESNSNTLHGGSNGYDKCNFLGPIAKQNSDNSITLQFLLIDNDGNNGFPSTIETIVKYTINENTITTEYIATIAENSPHDLTPVNLTNHTYFNLSHDQTIDNTKINLLTDKYLEFKNQLPTGEILTINDSTFTLNPSIVHDDCYIFEDSPNQLDTRSLNLKKILTASIENHSLVVESTDPSFQFYTGDYVNIEKFGSRSGFCVEPGRFTNAINNKNWQNQVLLKKGDTYGSLMKYTFT